MQACSGKIIKLEAKHTDTIYGVKDKISVKKSIPLYQQSIIFAYK